jgi:hypothetical protein
MAELNNLFTTEDEDEDNWDIIWLEAWLHCIDIALGNLILTLEYGSEEDSNVFIGQLKRAVPYAIDRLKSIQIQRLSSNSPCEEAGGLHPASGQGTAPPNASATR